VRLPGTGKVETAAERNNDADVMFPSPVFRDHGAILGQEYREFGMHLKSGVVVAAALCLAAGLWTGPAQARVFAGGGVILPLAVEPVQYSRAESRAISRCMRQKFGVRSGRIRSPLRFFMVQQCS
jgi:hypothetical protein